MALWREVEVYVREGADVMGPVVLQDGRSAYCGIFDDAGFWMKDAIT